MKILQVVPSLRIGGAEIMCTHLACRLAALGHDVCVAYLVDMPSPLSVRLSAAGVTVRSLGKKLGVDFSHLGRLRRLIKDFRPDIIHTHGNVLKYVAMSTLALPVRGYAHTIHSVADKETNAVDLFCNRLGFRNKARIVVALSGRIRQSIAQTYAKVPADALHKCKLQSLATHGIPVINNGIPLPEQTPARSYAFGDSIRIVHVARYSPEKNQRALLQAVVALHAMDQRVRLDLYGEGPLKDEINEFIRANKAESFISDHGLTDDTPAVLARGDIFVLPSSYEGTPMTLIEAMAAAIPIVATAVGGIPDMLTEGKEALFCTTDAAGIEAALARMIEDEALRLTLGQAAFARAADYSDLRMAKEYEAVYKRLLN